MKKKLLTLIEPAHHIPFTKEDILSELVTQLDSDKITDANKFFMLIKNQVHLEFYQTIEELDHNYKPFNPNTVEQESSIQPDSSTFIKHLKYALTKANYKALGDAELAEALEATSLFKIRLFVDFNDYQQTILFTRGESIRKEEVALFGRFFKREIEFNNYDSVVMFLHLKDEIVDSTLQESCVPGSVVLKMFHNVPKADIEMLFPNTKIRMRLKDKLMIGIPALISGVVMAVTKLGASFIIIAALVGFWFGFSDEPVDLNKTSLLALMAGLGTIAGYMWKQFSGFNKKKLKFVQTLIENLYFKNLDNNEGVYYRLVNEAEKEEVKEILLAYFYLLQSKKPLDVKELDTGLEQWIKETWDCSVNFDIDDAIEKLKRLDLVTQVDSSFTAVNLSDAIQHLDHRWDNYLST